VAVTVDVPFPVAVTVAWNGAEGFEITISQSTGATAGGVPVAAPTEKVWFSDGRPSAWTEMATVSRASEGSTST
jgi:hypothetical protein